MSFGLQKYSLLENNDTYRTLIVNKKLWNHIMLLYKLKETLASCCYSFSLQEVKVSSDDDHVIKTFSRMFWKVKDKQTNKGNTQSKPEVLN